MSTTNLTTTISITTTGPDCPLICTFVNPESPRKGIPLNFRRDAEKKSAFWLQEGDHTVIAPAHCIIFSQQETPFALGGFQFISNARTVEVYLVEVKHGDKEVYLTTCRGIPTDGEDNYKVTCVVPGGPRAVSTVHLKLLSLKPAKTKTARLCSIKLTARLPEAAAPPTITSSLSNSSNTTPTETPASSARTPPSATRKSSGSSSNSSKEMRLPPRVLAAANNPSPPTALTGEDLGAAMAGLSYLVRSTQDTLRQCVQDSQKLVQQNINESMFQIQQQVQQVQISQQRLLEQQSVLLQQQAEMIQKQGEQLSALRQQQEQFASILLPERVAECIATTATRQNVEVPTLIDSEVAGAGAGSVDDENESSSSSTTATTTRGDVSVDAQATTECKKPLTVESIEAEEVVLTREDYSL